MNFMRLNFMRRIVAIIVSFIMGAVLAVPTLGSTFSCYAAESGSTTEPENAFCIYGVTGMQITIEAGDEIIDYTFVNGSTHYDNPYVISSSKISDWYSHNVPAIHIIAGNTSSITLTSTSAIISASAPDGASMTEIFISGDDGTPLSFVTKLLSLKRMYLFPIGYSPNVAGVTPTPFVNDGSDIVVDDAELKNTIGAVSEFKPFMQFIFVSVIPWAGFAAVMILVFATIKFMLKG